ncbi:frequency clock protein domain-containing protein [Pochonia chlamydosporia 170]|uniref:Frequency clock protein domain-containing protein n=1 Tax=Pochonia chlamydosporia 170 TaxID=1380566 RepID=A0A179EYK0_METCM|nr:frequency clock protein domain-containing protein [Pochonia chlamydosporia 170]OAQ58248.1 frequency clock protein domain-containing protein [Pochonia chlamydosporia 170]
MSSVEVGTVNNIPSPREYLSTESQIDAENWFNYCNENPASTLGLLDYANGLPFYQQLSGSPFDRQPSPTQYRATAWSKVVHSDDADDYRQIIDDLTVEIQGLKRQLRQHRQQQVSSQQQDALFEVKVYYLSEQEKQTLDRLLQTFVVNTEDLLDTSCRHWEQPSARSPDANLSFYSNTRRVDSTYASRPTREPCREAPVDCVLDAPSHDTPHRNDVVIYRRGSSTFSDLSLDSKNE